MAKSCTPFLEEKANRQTFVDTAYEKEVGGQRETCSDDIFTG